MLLGILAAAVNATCLALIHAGIPMRDYFLAISATWTAPGHHLVDLNRSEEGWGHSHSTLCWQPTSGRLLAMLMEPPRLAWDKLEPLMDGSAQACLILWQRLREDCITPYGLQMTGRIKRESQLIE